MTYSGIRCLRTAIYQSEKSWFRERKRASPSFFLFLSPRQRTIAQTLIYVTLGKKGEILFCSLRGLRFSVPCIRDNVCARANWPIDERATPGCLFIHPLRPATNCIVAYTDARPLSPSPSHARTRNPSAGGELLPKNESDVKLRPDWFTSEATSLGIHVGRAGSTIGNLPR